MIKAVHRRVNLWDIEAVDEYILNNPRMTEGRKQLVSYAYRDWCEFQGFTYKVRKFKREEKLPYIPTEKMLDQLISSTRYHQGFLQLLKEIGCNPEEALRLEVRDIDRDQQKISINKPTKGHRTGQYRVSSKLMSMLIPRLYGKKLLDRVFDIEYKTLQRAVLRNRKRLAEAFQNPNFNLISMKTFRHFKGTTEYHRTKDILHVQKILRHRSLKNTLVYTHLVEWKDDNWIVKVADTLEETVQLLESGFEYITDYEDKKLFRKRK